MSLRSVVKGILRYELSGPMPLVHFGFWGETLRKWAEQGHIEMSDAREAGDASAAETRIGQKLGFDLNYHSVFNFSGALRPGFPGSVIEELPDGSRKVLNGDGVVVLEKPGAGSIPMEFDHLLKDRESWETHFRHRLQFSPERYQDAGVMVDDRWLAFDKGGRDYLAGDKREHLYGLFCGSLLGQIRSWLGVEGMCYLQADDPDLFSEIVATNADVWYETTKGVLESGAKFDFAHFWEDICYKSGPLVSPRVFREVVGPHYRRITALVVGYGLDIVSLDCDGRIDALVPIWLENGVNTMFPIEVGTWGASIRPWREQYGRQVRGVGGMNKTVFARDRAAVDAEIERLRPLVALGGYIPCPDHRIAPDAEWDNVAYYCERMRKVFGD